jgi:TIR domain
VFGDSQVFLDTEHVGIGEDFVDRTTRVVGSCRAVLVVIGQRWLSVVDAQGRRRLDDEDDYVRLEIATALRRAPPTAVIPVLVHGARMPTEEELPVDLRALSRRNALVAPDERWRPEVDRLIERLETIMRDPEEHPGSSAPSAPPAGGPTGPDDARA